MFIILESGMALFAIQLVRVVITSLVATPVVQTPPTLIALDFVIGIHKMLNAIIIFVDFYFFCFTDSDIYLFFWLGHCINDNFDAGFDDEQSFSRKLPEVFVLIIPQVPAIRILVHFGEWEVTVLCRPRRGIMRVFV